MENTFRILLIVHILSGGIGLVTGLINIVQKKGGRRHVLVGNIFTYAMLTTGTVALVLSQMHRNDFLFIVGIFTLYLVGTGKRYVYFKMTNPTVKPQAIDWLLSGGMILGGIVFIVLGYNLLVANNSFGFVPITFAVIGMLFAILDIRYYTNPEKPKKFWLRAHLQRMIAGFIAALTAFLVVNVRYFPEGIPSVVYWLLPTVVLSPLIARWSVKYSK